MTKMECAGPFVLKYAACPINWSCHIIQLSERVFDLIQVYGTKYKPLKLLLYYFHNDCTYKIYQVVLYFMRNKYMK